MNSKVTGYFCHEGGGLRRKKKRSAVVTAGTKGGKTKVLTSGNRGDQWGFGEEDKKLIKDKRKLEGGKEKWRGRCNA